MSTHTSRSQAKHHYTNTNEFSIIRFYKNQCADFMVKFEASSDNEITIHPSPPKGLLNFLRANEAGTFFPRE